MLGFDRITFDSHVMGGRACIRGMRITVEARRALRGRLPLTPLPCWVSPSSSQAASGGGETAAASRSGTA
jgi:hypothetical protein